MTLLNIDSSPQQAFWLRAVRWVLVLPAAVLGSFVFYGAARLLTHLTAVGVPPNLAWVIKVVSLGLGWVAAGASFVLAGVFTAPSRRRVVRITLTAIVGLWCMANAIFIFANEGVTWELAYSVLVFGGAFYALPIADGIIYNQL